MGGRPSTVTFVYVRSQYALGTHVFVIARATTQESYISDT